MKVYGANAIAKELTEKKIKTPKGKDKWHDTTVRKILRNEKYKGDVLQGKTFTLDPISHKRMTNMGEEDKYYIEDHHEPIIDSETFDKVQSIMNERVGRRSATRKSDNVGRQYPMSNRLYCGFCGSVLNKRCLYETDNEESKPAWLCRTRSKLGKEYCEDGKTVKAEVLENAFIDTYKLLCENNLSVVDEFLQVVEKTMKSSPQQNNIKRLETQKQQLEEKCNKLLDFMLDGIIDLETYTSKKNECLEKIEEIRDNIQQEKKSTIDEGTINKKISTFKKAFEDNQILNEFDVDIFDALVDYVIIRRI